MRSTLKELARMLLPQAFIERYRAGKRSAYRRVNEKTPVKDVFTRIYRENEWGGRPGEFRSGSGSAERFAASYAEMVKGYIRQNRITRVVDLGCGDFGVGSRLLIEGVDYIGVDIVDELIAHNRNLHGREGVSFLSLDIIADPLPEGELCLIRQVLQHLSNAEIASVLDKVGGFRHVIITEHYPAPSVPLEPNRDKPHGGDTRVVDGSAVCLDLPPFGMKIERLMLEVEAEPLVASGETLRSFLIVNEV